MKRSRQKWTARQIEQLNTLREVERLTWEEIGARFGCTGPSACTRYNYYRLKRRAEAARAANEFVPSVHDEPDPPAPAPRRAAAAASEQGKRPRYFSDADAEIRARIARQGITAGILGDPPAGRSALDQRRGGAS